MCQMAESTSVRQSRPVRAGRGAPGRVYDDRVGSRQRWGAVAVAVTVAAVFACTPWAGWETTVPVAVGLAAVGWLAVLRSSRPRDVHVAATVTGLVSLGATASVLSRPHEESAVAEWWGLAETAVLIVLVAVAVRWGRKAWGVLAVVTVVVAQVGWILRTVPERTAGVMVVAALFWSAGSWVGAFVGGYPRYAALRLRRTVASARAEQRRRLERDLHDYVAHDVSGILAQAQAAQFAAGDDPDALRRILARIEGSAQNALTTMDRTMQLLREDSDEAPTAPHARQPDLTDLPALVAAFSAASAAEVRCDVDYSLDRVPALVSATAHRVVAEALTNVRRHAPLSSSVAVGVAADDAVATLRVTVENSPAPPREPVPGSRAGGTGLERLRELVCGVGGTFTAGPRGDAWLVDARLPLRAPNTAREGTA